VINKVIRVAKMAATEILKIYVENNFSILSKDDNSPVTKADLIANEIIIKELGKISDYPIITEEIPVAYKKRKNWKKFWLVDPLDGTKDFIAKNGEFTINIALIEKNKPVLGVVYIPVCDEVYYAEIEKGAFKNGTRIFNSSNRKKLIATDSNFHSTQDVQDFFRKFDIQNVIKYGSSIKICKLAEGSIDVNQTILTGVAEHRIQPNTYLTATCISSERAYFITLFDATRDGLIDQIISSTSKTKLRSYAPYWYDEGMSSSDSITSNWESSFSSGHLVYGKGDIDAQIAAYGETSESFKND